MRFAELVMGVWSWTHGEGNANRVRVHNRQTGTVTEHSAWKAALSHLPERQICVLMYVIKVLQHLGLVFLKGIAKNEELLAGCMSTCLPVGDCHAGEVPSHYLLSASASLLRMKMD